MVKTTILNSINSGNVTVESIKANTHLSPKAIEVGLDELTRDGIIAINKQGNYYLCYSYGDNEVTPNKNTSIKNIGDKMNSKNNSQATGSKTQKLNCTPEQRAFATNVCQNKGKIFDAQQKEGVVLTHRGAQVLFGGAGDKSLRYKIAVSGFSDKEPVEYAIMYLDWDDSALYEEGGLADQIKEIIGSQNSLVTIAPAIVAQAGGK